MSDFAHRLPLDQIRDGDRLDVCADDAERRAVADRLGLLSLDRFEAHAVLSRDGQKVRACGRLKASLEQACVATGEAIPARIDEPFELLFVPEPTAGGGDEEVELAGNELDMVFHDGAAIDLGGAVADSLALTLDPYPRSAGADAALKEAGVLTEEEAGPFAALAALKSKLGGGGP
ncbi:MAG: YceD family protein [Sphingomicrobium sp.]